MEHLWSIPKSETWKSPSFHLNVMRRSRTSSLPPDVMLSPSALAAR